MFGVPFDLERLTYTTVVLMSVLVVYDKWGELTTFVGTALVIIGPILAIALAHGFSEALHDMSEAGRPSPAPNGVTCCWRRHQVLLAAVPPLLVVVVGYISPLDAESTITVLIATATVTLVALAAFAAYRAGLRGWRLLVAACVGGLIGLVVVSLQILLKPK